MNCPKFLINYIKEDLKLKIIIWIDFNIKTKKLNFICFGKNKVKIFKKKFKNRRIDKFYTDSLSDIPFMELAQEVYFVNKDKIKKIDKSRYI